MLGRGDDGLLGVMALLLECQEVLLADVQCLCSRGVGGGCLRCGPDGDEFCFGGELRGEFCLLDGSSNNGGGVRSRSCGCK